MGINEYRERLSRDRVLLDATVNVAYSNLTARELKLRTQMGTLMIIRSIEQTVGLTSNRGIGFVEQVFNELTAPELMGMEMPADQGQDELPRTALDLTGSLLESGFVELQLDRSLEITDQGRKLLAQRSPVS